jgi:hypothetical protein
MSTDRRDFSRPISESNAPRTPGTAAYATNGAHTPGEYTYTPPAECVGSAWKKGCQCGAQGKPEIGIRENQGHESLTARPGFHALAAPTNGPGILDVRPLFVTPTAPARDIAPLLAEVQDKCVMVDGLVSTLKGRWRYARTAGLDIHG